MVYTFFSGNIIGFTCLVIIWVSEHGSKELIGVKDAYRESEVNLAELLNGLHKRVAYRISHACYWRWCPILFSIK
ncbi:MAG: hypothetical protein ACTS73_00515 [Arsenophonus sp. NEOnobi-MAG3]